jgi:hypothetical protein
MLAQAEQARRAAAAEGAAAGAPQAPWWRFRLSWPLRVLRTAR